MQEHALRRNCNNIKEVIYRAVPVPPALLDALDLVHGIREAQRRGHAKAMLWPWSRMTAFRREGTTAPDGYVPSGERNSSRFRPSASRVWSHFGMRPRPDQVSPLGPRYLTGNS